MSTTRFELSEAVKKNPVIATWLTLSFALFFFGPFLTSSYGDLTHLSKVTFFLPAMVYLFRQQGKGGAPFSLDTTAVLFLSFLFLGLVSLLWAPEPRISRMTHGALQIFLLLFTLRQLGKTHPDTLVASTILAALGTAAVTVAITLCFYGSNDLSVPLYDTMDGLDQAFPNINQLVATMTAMPSAFILTAAFAFEKRAAQRIIFLLGAVSCLVFLLMLQRRTGMVAILGGMAVLVMLTRNKKLIIALISILLCGLFFFFNDISGYASRGDTHRFDVWHAYLNVSMAHPWLGHGLTDEVPTITTQEFPHLPYDILHPHNILLSLFYYMGIAGLVLFAGFGLNLAYRIFLNRTFERRVSIVLLAPLTPGLITLMFDGEKIITPYWPSWNCLWIPIALAVAAVHSPDRKTAPNLPENADGRVSR
ncbi:MAG TPA: O-antigen ligase family protein [Alcanivorax sp.]|nr:O-antigen ligase family protein [Alcanivorax sp.]